MREAALLIPGQAQGCGSCALAGEAPRRRGGARIPRTLSRNMECCLAEGPGSESRDAVGQAVARHPNVITPVQKLRGGASEDLT